MKQLYSIKYNTNNNNAFKQLKDFKLMNSKTVDQLKKLLEVSPNIPVILNLEREGIVIHPFVYVQAVDYREIRVAQTPKGEKSSTQTNLTFNRDEVGENIRVPNSPKKSYLNSKKTRKNLTYQTNSDSEFIGKVKVKIATPDRRNKGLIHPIGFFEGIVKGEVAGKSIEHIALGTVSDSEVSRKGDNEKIIRQRREKGRYDLDSLRFYPIELTEPLEVILSTQKLETYLASLPP
jgi:hypothetical protein